jgi:SAM-dependent methyltransferase
MTATDVQRPPTRGASKIAIPPSAVPFIGLQWPGAAKAVGFPEPAGQIQALRQVTDEQANVIKAFYLRNLLTDWRVIRPALPRTARAILDIGCGLAGIDVLLFRYYRPRAEGEGPHIYLLDKSEVSDRMTYGFSGRNRFYASLDEARRLLIQNGVPNDKIHLVEVGKQLPWAGDIDLVLSLASWGFHYPLATHLDYVRAVLLNGGVGITDVRNEKESIDTLRAAFADVEIIQEHANRKRVAFSSVVSRAQQPGATAAKDAARGR